MAAIGCVGFASACSHEVQSPSVELDRLEPDLMCSEQFPSGELELTIHGSGFTPLPLQTLEEPAMLELPSVVLTHAAGIDGSGGTGEEVLFSGVDGEENSSRLGWQSKEQMTMSIAESVGLAAGVYDLKVTNPDGKSSAEKTSALAVIPPPSIEQLLPEALCDGLSDQELRIAGENFVEVDGVGPSVEFTDASGASYTFEVATLDDCTEIPGLRESVSVCSLAAVPIPARELPEGRYDIVITNPPPVGCSSSDAVSIQVVNEGPVLFFVDPPFVYNGINTRATLYLTSVAEPFSVSLVPSGALAPLTELDAALVVGKDNRITATVPAGLDPGSYDVIVNDDTGCQTLLEEGIVVTDDLAIQVGNVVDPFVYTDGSTAVTVFADSGAEFTPTPRVFLNPADGGATDTAIALESVTVVETDELNAVVPSGVPVGAYDVVVVNPTGEVGVLMGGFTSVGDPPPVVRDVVPQSIVGQADQSLSVLGSDFRDATLSARCEDLNGQSVSAPSIATGAQMCDAGSCSLEAVVDGSVLPSGTVCVLRVENSDGSYGEFSAIGVTNSSFNLSTPKPGRPMTVPRAGLVAAAVKATSAARFVYAIGGNDGDPGAPYDNVEVAPVNVFGTMSDFAVTRQGLKSPRTAHGGAQIGRYVYVAGGNDGAGALASAERALVLSPEEIAHIEDLDLCLSGSDEPCFEVEDGGDGLAAGDYSYRVAALIDAADPENLGGETLASDPLILRLPEVRGRNIVLQLTWSAPVDPLGEELSGIVGWRVYRTPTDGVPARDEVLLAEIDDPDQRSFIDDGTLALGSRTPLPLGSTSSWQALPDLNSAREGLSVAAARDPDTASEWHVYALLGAGENGYEHLTVTLAANGRQTVASAWQAGSETSAVARTEFGAWVVDSVVSDTVPAGETYIFLGGGLANGMHDNRVEAARVSAGGELDAFTDDPGAQDPVGDFSSTRVGYGTAAAAGRLFLFGGLASQVRDNATAAELVSPAPGLSNNAWNNEGLTMTSARYLMGSSIQSAFIFLLGGQTEASGSATASTELVVW